jgi:serine/threonine protein kinase
VAWICSQCGESSPRQRPKCARDGAPVVEDLAGQVVGGRYRVQELVGVGGMDSAVWRAWQMGTERVVAIKVLPPADDAAARRFSRGARIAANLSHPNCCIIHDYGTTEDGKLYLVMEFLAGKVLNEVLTSDGFPPHDTVHIADQILQALEHAHAERTVHRDLKPDNLFLVRKNDDPMHVKILDFGIAKYIEDEHEEISTGPNDTARDGFDDLVTEQRQVCGTPQYMAPEQIVGARVDGRADLYALGCVMYRLLTGRLPFDGKNRYDLYRKHLEESPRPFSAVRPDLSFPDRLELVVMKALTKNPAHRFQSAAEMRAALATLDLGPARPRRATQALGAPVSRETYDSDAPTVEVAEPGRSPATRQLKPVGSISGGGTRSLDAPAPTVAGSSGLRGASPRQFTTGPSSSEVPVTEAFEGPSQAASPPRPQTTLLARPGHERGAIPPTVEVRVPAGASTEPSRAGRPPRTERPAWLTGVVLAAAFLIGVVGVGLLLPLLDDERATTPLTTDRIAVTAPVPTPPAQRATAPTALPEATTATIEPAGAPAAEPQPEVPGATAWPLRLESVPPGATVLLAGHEVGVTPLTVDVGTGTHVFSLRLAGHTDATLPVTVHGEADASKPRVVMLAPIRPTSGRAALPAGGGLPPRPATPQPAPAPTPAPGAEEPATPRPVVAPAPPAPAPSAAAEPAPRRPRTRTLDEVDKE